MRKAVTAIIALASLTAASAPAPTQAKDDCWECWAGAAILLGGIHPANAGYASGYLPGIYSPYYGYAPGYSDYPRPHAHLPTLHAPRGYRSVRYANRVQFVQPAAFDPSRK